MVSGGRVVVVSGGAVVVGGLGRRRPLGRGRRPLASVSSPSPDSAELMPMPAATSDDHHARRTSGRHGCGAPTSAPTRARAARRGPPGLGGAAAGPPAVCWGVWSARVGHGGSLLRQEWVPGASASPGSRGSGQANDRSPRSDVSGRRRVPSDTRSSVKRHRGAAEGTEASARCGRQGGSGRSELLERRPRQEQPLLAGPGGSGPAPRSCRRCRSCRGSRPRRTRCGARRRRP